jgi:CBS domain containing-hemolysin-like protein
MTIALIVGGEIVPKTFAVKRAESIVRKVAGIVWLCSLIILPIRRILLKVADIFVLFIEKRLRLKRVRPLFTQEVLSTALKMGEEEKAIEESDLKMMRGILRFGKGVVRDVMTPKERIVSSSKNGTIEEIIRLIQKTGYSRIPIYEGRVDNIIGVVHARDLLPYMDEGKEPELSRLIRDVYIVSPAKRVDDLLHEMQTRRYQMAIVRTHHGRLLGLVTMEDLLEEIFGEIEDEYDLLVMGGKG